MIFIYAGTFPWEADIIVTETLLCVHPISSYFLLFKYYGLEDDPGS